MIRKTTPDGREKFLLAGGSLKFQRLFRDAVNINVAWEAHAGKGRRRRNVRRKLQRDL